MARGRVISIWFFIGLSLLINGALIVAAGVYDWVRPPAHPVVLHGLHASVWWGGVLFLAGVFYCVRFAPGRDETGPGIAERSDR